MKVFRSARIASAGTFGNGIVNKDYAVAVARFEGGYTIEYRIPLTSIDMDDGARSLTQDPVRR